jgi:hypothetical protein
MSATRSTTQNTRRRSARSLALVGVSAAVAGYLAGKALNARPVADAPGGAPAPVAALQDSRTKLKHSPPNFSGIATSKYGCFDDAGGARRLFERLFTELDFFRRGHATEEPLESYANAISPQLRVLATTFGTMGPATIDQVKGAFREEMCVEGQKPRSLMTLAYLGVLLPDLITPEALTCYFNRSPPENILTFAMLRAWRGAGQPPVPGVERLRATTMDPGVKRQFLSPREELALRRVVPSAPQPSRAVPGRPAALKAAAMSQ